MLVLKSLARVVVRLHPGTRERLKERKSAAPVAVVVLGSLMAPAVRKALGYQSPGRWFL